MAKPKPKRSTSLIDATSLSRTVDAVQAAMFDGAALSADERLEAARWIAARQGLPGAYAETFAGFPRELADGIVLFTGERLTSASARHVLGEEACRTLQQLRVRDAAVTASLDRAGAGLIRCLERAAEQPRHANPGLFCCGKCSVGLWRHLLAGGLNRQEERLRRGVGHLRAMRNGAAEWRRFPYWYTVLALSEMDVPEAAKELAYAAPALERTVRRAPPATVYAQRRHSIASRALARI